MDSSPGLEKIHTLAHTHIYTHSHKFSYLFQSLYFVPFYGSSLISVAYSSDERLSRFLFFVIRNNTTEKNLYIFLYLMHSS